MPFSQYLVDAREQYRKEVRLRNLWLIGWRWWYLSILCLTAIILSFTAFDGVGSSYRFFMAGICVSGLIFNLALWVFAQSLSFSTRIYNAIAIGQILLDASLAAVIIYFLGGIESRATVLFAIPILATGVLFVPVFAYIAAALCSILYIAAILAQQQFLPASFQIGGTLSPAVLYTMVFFLLALIVSGYTARNKTNERETSYAELLSLLRHQLHHPTGVIAAIVEMLEEGESYDKLAQRDKEYIRQLKYENNRIHVMINNLLKTAQAKEEAEKAAKNWTDVHLMSLITECAISVATGYKRINDLDDQLPNEDIIVHGNPEQLHIAFENIIENAFKYSNPGRKVSITLKTGTDPIIEIDIEDHGKGITDAEQKKLFRAFNKLEEPSTDSREAINTYSLGLGLYISKLIVEEHGGELELQSKTGEGTKVIIHLKRDMWRKLYGQKQSPNSVR